MNRYRHLMARRVKVKKPRPPECDLCGWGAVYVLHGVYLCWSCAPVSDPELVPVSGG